MGLSTPYYWSSAKMLCTYVPQRRAFHEKGLAQLSWAQSVKESLTIMARASKEDQKSLGHK
jgi:hypothetical protein